MGFFSGWTWQKWLSRIAKAVIGLASLIFTFIAPESAPDWQPAWWITLSPFILLIVDAVIGLIKVNQPPE